MASQRRASSPARLSNSTVNALMSSSSPRRMTGNSFRSNVLPRCRLRTSERQDHYLTERRVGALDGHGWGASTPIRGIGNLGSALDATVGSGVLQEAAARNYRGAGHRPTGGQHQTEEPGFA